MSEYTPHNWVNNETITAEKLNNIEQGVASASSSIGGLIVHVTIDNDTMTLDKTWQEIYDAVENGAYIQIVGYEDDAYYFYILKTIFFEDSQYGIIIFNFNNFISLQADSPNSYPSYTDSSTPVN